MQLSQVAFNPQAILDIVNDIQTKMSQQLLSCGVLYSLILKEPSTPSITTFTMAFVEQLMIGPPHISKTARKQRK